MAFVSTLLVALILGVSPRSAVLGAVIIGLAARGTGTALTMVGLRPRGGLVVNDVLGWVAAPVVVGTVSALGSGAGGPPLSKAGLLTLAATGLVLRRDDAANEPRKRADGEIHALTLVPVLCMVIILPWFNDFPGLTVTALAVALYVGMARETPGRRITTGHAVLVLAGILVARVIAAGWDSVDLTRLRSPLLSNDVFFDEAQALAIADRGASVDPLALGGTIGYHRLPHSFVGTLHRVVGMQPFEASAGVGIAVGVVGIALLLATATRLGARSRLMELQGVTVLMLAAGAGPIEPVWLVEFPKIGNVLGLTLFGALLLLQSPRIGLDQSMRSHVASATLVLGLVGSKLQFAVVGVLAVIAYAIVARRPWRHVVALAGTVSVASAVGFFFWFRSVDRLLTWSEGDASTRVNQSVSAILRELTEGSMAPVLWRVTPLVLAFICVRSYAMSAGAVAMATSMLVAVLAGEPSKFASAALMGGILSIASFDEEAATRFRMAFRLRLGAIPLAVGAVAAFAFEAIKWSYPQDSARRPFYDALRSEYTVLTVLSLLSVAWAAVFRWNRPRARPTWRDWVGALAACAVLIQMGSFAVKTARTHITEWRYPSIQRGTELQMGLVEIGEIVRDEMPTDAMLATNTFCHAPRRDDDCVGVGSSVQIAPLTQRILFLEAPVLRSTAEDFDVRGRAGTSLRFALFADPLAAGELRAAGVTHFVVDMRRTSRTSWEPVGRTVMISGDFALLELRDPSEAPRGA
ncbi:MAG: hypothetical protein ACKORC_04845 [Acidimicrobiia bacterium]